MESYENLPEIAAVPGVDVIMVGPLDLSATVGSMGDTRAPAVLEIMEDVPKILEGTGVACATTLVPYEHHELAVQWGYGPPTQPTHASSVLRLPFLVITLLRVLKPLSNSGVWCRRAERRQPAGVRPGHGDGPARPPARRRARRAEYVPQPLFLACAAFSLAAFCLLATKSYRSCGAQSSEEGQEQEQERRGARRGLLDGGECWLEVNEVDRFQRNRYPSLMRLAGGWSAWTNISSCTFAQL